MVKQKKVTEDLGLIRTKAASRLQINTRLLAVSFMIFIFIMSVKPEIFSENNIIAIQLVLAIPLLLTSTLSRSKMGYSRENSRWNKLGWITFIVSYAFLLNIVGILIAVYISLFIALIFFVASWILAIIYSFVEVSYDKSLLKKRIFRDLFFIVLQVVFGVLPALGVI